MADATPEVLNLPGGELVVEGIADLQAGRETQAALLVATAAERLRSAGLEVPHELPSLPSHRLYAQLAGTAGDDAHGRYNALLGRVSSFARALESKGTNGD